jgi:hypothetical protein
MTWEPADRIHRTAKILIDSGRAADPAAARRQLEAMVLQVAVGPGIRHDRAAQAALVTAVNAGRRAFLGGVHVHLATDPLLDAGWGAGLTAAQAAAAYGGRVVTRLSVTRPTITIGRPEAPPGRPVLHLGWNGWAGGVVQEADSLPAGDGTAIAGTAAAASAFPKPSSSSFGPLSRDDGTSASHCGAPTSTGATEKRSARHCSTCRPACGCSAWGTSARPTPGRSACSPTPPRAKHSSASSTSTPWSKATPLPSFWSARAT